METAERLAGVKDRMARAAKRAGRPAGSVQLVIVTKGVEAARLPELMGEPVLFGESRVQEALEKQRALAGKGDGAERVRWHFIGRLQRNKVRMVVGLFDLIHSVDSVELAREIDRIAARANREQEILLQVNLSGEASKQGFSPDDAERALGEIRTLSHLSIRGVMTIPPLPRLPEDSRPYFRRLRLLSEKLGLAERSMGMSGDFEVAIEEGATLVRIGTAIFGERN